MPNYSFSSIERYLSCSEKHRLWNDKSIPRPVDTSVPMVAGDIAHQMLEQYYGPMERLVEPVDLLEMYWREELENMGLPEAMDEFKALAHARSTLYLRASEDYRGKDAIRTAAGKPSKKPEATKDWERAAAALQFNERRLLLNQDAAASTPDPYSVVTLTDVFAETYLFLDGYKDILPNHEVVHIEMPISSPVKGDDPRTGERYNLVKFPGTDDHFTGYIDLVTRDHLGRLYLIDHKTSKKQPSSGVVAHWEQLLLYGWAYEQIHGERPNYIGIHHLRSKELVLAAFDYEEACRAVVRKMQAIRAIKAGVYIQQNPTDFGSRCYQIFGTDENTEPTLCPYLEHCHPRFFAMAKGGRV